MGWFSRDAEPTADDAVLLRDALVQVLSTVQATSPPRTVKRLRKVVERLERFPAPTGLCRELSTALPERPSLEPAGGARSRDDAGAGEAAEMARGLADTMAVAALLDGSLADEIDSFRGGLPDRLGPAEARRIVQDLSGVRSAAGLARERARQEREEVAALIADLAGELDAASARGAQLDGGLRVVSKVLSAGIDPTAFATARDKLVVAVRELSVQASAMQSQLVHANQRSQALQQAVKEREKELLDVKAKAAKDALTGACNRGTFDRFLKERRRHALHTGTPLSLILLDVDHFKRVNDLRGHSVGDDVLKGLATLLETYVRDGDLVARVGGEEFAVVLPGASMLVAEDVAERIRESLADTTFESPQGLFHVTVSCGVALLDHSGEESERSFYERADKALYTSKTGGRNRVSRAA